MFLRHCKTALCLMSLWQKLNKTTREFYHLFLKIMRKWIKWDKAFLKFFTSPPSHFSSRCWTILIFSSQNDPQRGIAAECWQYTYSYEILKWFVNHHINIKVLISNFFQLEIELYCEKCLCTHFDYMSKVETNKKWK